jgi:hypothetical protein
MLTYDAAVGRIEPGQDYLVEDDKAERWINAGMASIAPDKPAPAPAPAEPEDEGDEEPEATGEEEHDPDLAAEVRTLFEAGHSERSIAQQLGISRPHVHTLLQS